MYAYYEYFSDLWLITCWAAMLLCFIGLSAGQQKCCTKRCLEFENNMVGCMIFQWRLTCQLGSYCGYIYVSLSGLLTIHPDPVLLTLSSCTGLFLHVCWFFLSPDYLLLFYGIVLCLPHFEHLWWHFIPHIDHMYCLWSLPFHWCIMLDYYWHCSVFLQVDQLLSFFMCHLFLEMHLPLFWCFLLLFDYNSSKIGQVLCILGYL